MNPFEWMLLLAATAVSAAALRALFGALKLHRQIK